MMGETRPKNQYQDTTEIKRSINKIRNLLVKLVNIDRMKPKQICLMIQNNKKLQSDILKKQPQLQKEIDRIINAKYKNQ